MKKMISLFSMLGIGICCSLLMFFMEKFLPSNCFNEDKDLMLQKCRTLAHEKIQEIEQLLENGHEKPMIIDENIDQLKQNLTEFINKDP